jgi:hypothetical protein
VNLEDAVSLYWSERDKATVIAFIGGETPSSWKKKPDQILGSKITPCGLVKRRTREKKGGLCRDARCRAGTEITTGDLLGDAPRLLR